MIMSNQTITLDPDESLENVQQEVKLLPQEAETSQLAISMLTDTVLTVKEQLDRSMEQNNSIQTNTTGMSNHLNKECELIQNSVEGSVKLIRQLISTKVDTSSDVGLMKKCNREDTQKVIRYSKQCNEYFLKYIKYPSADIEYCTAVKKLFGEAVELLYTACDAHGVSGVRGDITYIIVFTDNSDKTVYEFFNEIEMSLMGWGMNGQPVDDVSESYCAIKSHLIQDYGSADRIVSDIVVSLGARKCPAPGSKRDQYQFNVDLTKAVSKLDKLCKVPEINIEQLTGVLHL